MLFGVYGLQVTGVELAFKAGTSEWWKFFVSVLGHSDLEHLFNNAFFIGLFGSIFERLTSGKMFLRTFFISALFANTSAFIFFPDSYIIGASGGAMGVLGALAIYRPRKIGLVFGIPAPMWAVLAGYIFINLVGLTGATNVAYEAHLFGLVIGSVVGYRLREKPLLPEPENEDDWKDEIKEWEREHMLD